MVVVGNYHNIFAVTIGLCLRLCVPVSVHVYAGVLKRVGMTEVTFSGLS